MRVSLAWIGIILLTTVLVLFAVQAYMIYKEQAESEDENEGFQDAEANTNDIQLTSCPAETTSYINNNGMSLCCKTGLVNGTCPAGQLACTLSEGSASIPTCSTYASAVLDEKGKERCPASRPHYYENGLLRGCTAGRRKPDGTGPMNSADPQCVLYSLEADDQSKLDSCTNQRLLEKTVCFQGSSVKTTPQLFMTGAGIAIVSCSYTDPTTHMPGSCFSDESLYRFTDYIVAKGWWPKSYDWRSNWRGRTQWCSKNKKVYIDKTMSLADVEKDPIA